MALETRHEDLAWMAATGECLSGAAARLGLKRKSLERWAKRNAPDLLARLLDREPRDHNYDAAGKNQWT